MSLDNYLAEVKARALTCNPSVQARHVIQLAAIVERQQQALSRLHHSAGFGVTAIIDDCLADCEKVAEGK